MRERLELVPGRPPVVDGRVPPHDLDAEAAVLSACFLDQAAPDKIADFLRPEHFYAESHRRIFEAVLALSEIGQPFDVVAVGAWLKSRDRIAQVGGMGYLAQTLNAAPAVVNIRHYATIVFEKFRVRALIAACQKIAAEGYLDYGDTKTFLDSSEAALHAIAHLSHADGDGLKHVKEYVKESIGRVVEASKRPDRIVGIATGFERLDRLTSGLHVGELTVVAARPSMGKTGIVLQILANAAQVDDNAALFESLEMPGYQIGFRAVCTDAKVDLGKMRQGFITQADWSRIMLGAKTVAESSLWVNDRAGVTLANLRADIRRVRIEAEQRSKKLTLVAVDYLQLMRSPPVRGQSQNREQEVSALSRGLKVIAKEERVAVIALSQLNRSVESRSDKRPGLSDLRESGAIEQDADNIIFIYRDEYYTKDECTEPNIAELIVAKQRNGPVGTAKVRFDKEWVRFDNLADGEYVDE